MSDTRGTAVVCLCETFLSVNKHVTVYRGQPQSLSSALYCTISPCSAYYRPVFLVIIEAVEANLHACVESATFLALIDRDWESKHGLLSVIYLFPLLARGCWFRLLIAAVGTNRVHTQLDPYCVAGWQVKHTHTYARKQWYKKGETLGAAACELCLILIVFLETAVVPCCCRKVPLSCVSSRYRAARGVKQLF